MTEMIRRTVEMHPDFVKVLDELQIYYGLQNQEEVLQKAVHLLAIAKDRKMFVSQDGMIQELAIR